MINRKLFVAALMLAFFTMLPAARASEEDQATKLTFSNSVQIPGRVLAAGTYWFVVDPGSSYKVIRIFSSDRSTLYATLETASAEHLEAVDKTEITFVADRGGMQPEAIVTWFYPGRTIGQQFIYSKQQEKQIARNKQHTIITGDSGRVPGCSRRRSGGVTATASLFGEGS